MTRNVTLTAFGLLATLAASSLSPVLADGQQTNKNNARNIAIAGAAVAVYGLLSHNNTATLVGAAAGALGGSQYEKDRKQQSQDNNGRDYYRSDRNNNNDRHWNNSDRSRDTSGWSQGRGRSWDARSGYDNNGRQWNGDNNSRQWSDADYHRQGSGDGRQWSRDRSNSNTNRDGDRDVETCKDGGRHTHNR